MHAEDYNEILNRFFELYLFLLSYPIYIETFHVYWLQEKIFLTP